MTHLLTVSQMKGSHGGKIHDEPPPNTKTREVWDRLMSNKGLMVELSDIGLKPTYLKKILERFHDSWGLDIRCKRRSGGRKIGALHGLYCLVGEWDGRAYIDHVAERHAHTNSL